MTHPGVAAGGDHTVEEIQTWLIARIVGVDTEFTRLSLDSLVAVRISGELETLLGRPVDPMLLWDYPMVAAVAAHLAEGRPTSGSR